MKDISAMHLDYSINTLLTCTFTQTLYTAIKVKVNVEHCCLCGCCYGNVDISDQFEGCLLFA